MALLRKDHHFVPLALPIVGPVPFSQNLRLCWCWCSRIVESMLEGLIELLIPLGHRLQRDPMDCNVKALKRLCVSD